MNRQAETLVVLVVGGVGMVLAFAAVIGTVYLLVSFVWWFNHRPRPGEELPGDEDAGPYWTSLRVGVAVGLATFFLTCPCVLAVVGGVFGSH